MIIMDLLGWWYSRGWVWALRQLFVVRVQRIAEFFSIGDLLKTLFAPFRQDIIDTGRAPIGIRLQALGGNIISRILGALIRTTLILIGVLLIIAQAVLALIAAFIWPLIPASPAVALFLMMKGVGL